MISTSICQASKTLTAVRFLTETSLFLFAALSTTLSSISQPSLQCRITVWFLKMFDLTSVYILIQSVLFSSEIKSIMLLVFACGLGKRYVSLSVKITVSRCSLVQLPLDCFSNGTNNLFFLLFVVLVWLVSKCFGYSVEHVGFFVWGQIHLINSCFYICCFWSLKNGILDFRDYVNILSHTLTVD